jgi:hypothetical protein
MTAKQNELTGQALAEFLARTNQPITGSASLLECPSHFIHELRFPFVLLNDLPHISPTFIQ